VAGAPGPTAKNLTINNTQTVSAGVGSGLTITPAGNNSAFATNLQACTGIGITPSTTTNAVNIANTGVTQITAGTGVAVNQAAGNVTVSATGVQNVQSGGGIFISGAATNPVINNNGVTSVTAGTGISVSSNTGAPTIANTGVVQVVAGPGIAVSGTGTGTVTITNTDPSPATIVAGAGIGVSSQGGNTTITNTGVNSITSPVPGIQIGGTPQNPTISNSGVIQINTTGAGLNLTGNLPSLPILQNTGVTSITAAAPLVASSPTGGVNLSLSGNLVNYTQNTYQFNSTFPNDSTTVTQYGFAIPPWFGATNNSFMRITILMYEPAAQAWTNGLSGLVPDIRYYPSVPFAPSFIYLPNFVKPAGATTLKYVADLIQFQGLPTGNGVSALEITNFAGNPSINVYITVQFEFYQFSSQPIIQYSAPWPNVAQGQGSYVMTDYSVGYFSTS
jgi:hypothetical protein